MAKKRYNVILNPESVETVKDFLKIANISFSSYFTLLVDEFANVIDENGLSKKMDDLKMSDAMQMMTNIMSGIEKDKEKRKKKRLKSKA